MDKWVVVSPVIVPVSKSSVLEANAVVEAEARSTEES